MNWKLFAILTAAAVASVQAQEKTTGEKASEAWEATKKTTSEVTDRVVKKTQQAVEALEHKVDTPDADARKVNVQVTDKGVQMPKTLPAGKTAFVVTNKGEQKHNFEITGNNLEKSFWFSIAPGASKSMQVDLKPGRYDAACSVKDHAGKEGKTQLAVK